MSAFFDSEEIAGFRDLADSRMGAANHASRVTIHRQPAEPVRNPATGYFERPWVATHIDLPFRLGSSSSNSGQSREVSSGGVEVQRAVRVGHMPHDTSNLADGDLIEITAGECVGLVLRITDATWKDQATARRVEVVEAERPAEWG